MRTALRYVTTIVIGAVIGVGAAVQTIRAGALGSNVSIGPWQTGLDFGTVDASAKTRAIVALRGLLALPAREARYYTAGTDDAGQPLDGRCRYRVTGGVLPGKWWSITLYNRAGYLVANTANRYSVESATVAPRAATATAGMDPRVMQAMFAAERGWAITVAPTPPATRAQWLPTGNIDKFELTLRTYLPPDGGVGNPSRAALPAIMKEGC